MIGLKLLSEQTLKLWSWKTRKGHRNSCNFIIFKEYEPCHSNTRPLERDSRPAPKISQKLADNPILPAEFLNFFVKNSTLNVGSILRNTNKLKKS